MFALSVLVRVLLSVTLILNGSASAIAAARMATAPLHHAAGTHAAHEHPAIAANASELPAHHAAHSMAAPAGHDFAATPSPEESKDASDHCQPKNCLSECTQHCAAAISTISVQIAVIPRTGPMKLLQAGHLPPALPHLHRPPIG